MIAAFNQNIPFDRFITEQLAGDLLPKSSVQQQVASGFNRAGVFNTEGGIIQEEYRVEYVADRVHTTAAVFMGLTMQCARCHDHKFDPLTQRDYYRFFGFFNNIPDTPLSTKAQDPAEPFLRLPTAAQKKHLARMGTQIAQVQKQASYRRTTASPDAARWASRLTNAQRKK